MSTKDQLERMLKYDKEAQIPLEDFDVGTEAMVRWPGEANPRVGPGAPPLPERRVRIIEKLGKLTVKVCLVTAAGDTYSQGHKMNRAYLRSLRPGEMRTYETNEGGVA